MVKTEVAEKKQCCICGAEFSGWGANPEPFGIGRDRCCPECDVRFVIPVRAMVGRGTQNTGLLEFLTQLAKYGRLFSETRNMVRISKDKETV